MKHVKKLLAALMALAMCFAVVPVFAVGGSGETGARIFTAEEKEARIGELLDFSSRLNEMDSRCGVPEEMRVPEDEYSLARIIVKCRGELDYTGSIAAVSGYNDWHIIQYKTPEEAREAVKRYSAMDCVEYAEPDIIMTVDATPGSSSFNSWGFGASHVNMYAYNQWLYSQYGSDLSNMPTAIVAVVDTGADLDHPYLSGRLVQGYNFIADNNNPEDGHSHGTHVSGTVVDGTFSNVKIMPIKVLSDAGEGTTTQVCLGMEYGYLNGADVENLSLGGGCDGGEEHHMMAEVIDLAYDNGTTVCVAAGNESDDAANYCPANVERACTVAAINSSHSLCYFSNYGPLVDIAAPGSGIYSSVPGGGYGSKDGTSMACPHVAAVAAQIKTANPDMSADDVVSCIKGAAQSISVSNIGAGMLYLAPDMYTLDPAANAEGEYNHFVSSGSYAWTVDGDSVVSGNAGVNGSTSTMKTELSLGFEHKLTFDYKVSSEQGHDYFRVKANGSTIFETSGEQGWQTHTVTIPGSGSVALTFEFSKDSSGASGSDKAWVRNVKVEGSLSSAANITGGTVPFTSSGNYPWIVDEAENAAKSGNAGVDNSSSVMTATAQFKKGMKLVFKYKVSAASGDVFIFKCDGNTALTSGGTHGYTDFEFTVPYTGSHTLTFEFKKNTSGSSGDDCAYVKAFASYHSFESAINGSDSFLPFDNDSEYPWCAVHDYASSTNWGEDNSTSYLTLTLDMTAGETLSFRYRSSSENNYDFFRFYVDNAQQVQCSGNTSWSSFTFTAQTSKSYTFKWTFEKDYSAESYDDAAYVDDVVYSGTVFTADGDVNCDGVVDEQDALLVLRYSMELIGEEGLEIARGDVNNDGVVDAADALIILRWALGLAD